MSLLNRMMNGCGRSLNILKECNMEGSRGSSVKLGIFVAVGVLLFIAGIYYIGERQHLFTNTFRLSALFSDIGGLRVGDNVRFSGINVGVIDDIEQVTDSAVKVDMKIADRSRKFIKTNARATISSDGLMGDKLLVIMPGTPDAGVVAENDTLQSTKPASFDEILVKLKTAADNAADITTHLSLITGNISDGKGAIGKLFMDSVFAQDIGDAIVNIKDGAGGFKKNMDAASHNFLLRGYLKRKNRNKDEKK